MLHFTYDAARAAQCTAPYYIREPSLPAAARRAPSPQRPGGRGPPRAHARPSRRRPRLAKRALPSPGLRAPAPLRIRGIDEAIAKVRDNSTCKHTQVQTYQVQTYKSASALVAPRRSGGSARGDAHHQISTAESHTRLGVLGGRSVEAPRSLARGHGTSARARTSRASCLSTGNNRLSDVVVTTRTTERFVLH